MSILKKLGAKVTPLDKLGNEEQVILGIVRASELCHLLNKLTGFVFKEKEDLSYTTTLARLATLM